MTDKRKKKVSRKRPKSRPKKSASLAGELLGDPKTPANVKTVSASLLAWFRWIMKKNS